MYNTTQGQFIQTLFSEKVEPGVPATGRRFALDGIFTPDGKPIHMASIPEREAISFMATSMVLPVCAFCRCCCLVIMLFMFEL